MGIKKYKILILIFLLIFFNLQISMRYSPIDNKDYNINLNNDVKVSELDLPDKVYTFLAPSDTLTYEGLYLEGKYIYFILVEIVTPHNCTMRIKVWDPDNKQFNIFESPMDFGSEATRFFEVPFGTALSGDYKIEFYVVAPQNLNIHIKMEQGPKCLYDKMPTQEINNIIFYEVTKFDNGAYIEHNIKFETDEMYKFNIGRVSAISALESNVVSLDYIIEDPNGVEFEIYNGDPMADIDGINTFCFGTACKGVYQIKITIYCNAAYVNIAYAISDDYQISDIIDVNDTEPEDLGDTDSFEDFLNSMTSLPIAWTIGSLIFVGSIMAVFSVVLMQHRRKNAVNLNIKEK